MNFFYVLRDPAKAVELERRLRLTPYAENEFFYCRDTWAELEEDIERARRWYVKVRQSFAGNGKCFGYICNTNCSGMSKVVSAFRNSIDYFPVVTKRLSTVQIECQDALYIMHRHDGARTFMYLDPPYMLETRAYGSKKKYTHEMSIERHEKLLETCLTSKSMLLISGYQTELYGTMLSGWNSTTYETYCAAINARTPGYEKRDGRVEVLWRTEALQRRLVYGLLSQF